MVLPPMLYFGLLRVAYLSGRMLKHSLRFHAASRWQVPSEPQQSSGYVSHTRSPDTHSLACSHTPPFGMTTTMTSAFPTTFCLVECLLVSYSVSRARQVSLALSPQSLRSHSSHWRSQSTFSQWKGGGWSIPLSNHSPLATQLDKIYF